MKGYLMTITRVLVFGFLLLNAGVAAGQTITAVVGVPPATSGQWRIDISFSQTVDRSRIKHMFLVKTHEPGVIELGNLHAGQLGLYSATPLESLKIVADLKGNQQLPYVLHARLGNVDPNGPDLSLSATVVLLDETKALDKVVKTKAKDIDDADFYISGELNGAHDRKATYSASIKLERYVNLTPSWRHTPFFKLNASTDPDADPDNMELGWAFRYVADRGYFDNKAKFESERDFDNTNLIYDTRFTYLPRAAPKGRSNAKLFLNPFIGGEFGKNLRSPLQAAEGDGIARLLAGADVRLAIWLHKDSEGPEINWTTSYIRRWLLSDELGFEADDDGNLQLRTFGKSPRDHFSSKVSYSLNEFLAVFTEYEWGQVPPSFKLVDHRFRVGFAFKHKFSIK